MGTILENWKTTLGGIGTILCALGDLAIFASHGQVSPHAGADFAAISAGAGLIFAKDAPKKAPQ